MKTIKNKFMVKNAELSHTYTLIVYKGYEVVMYIYIGANPDSTARIAISIPQNDTLECMGFVTIFDSPKNIINCTDEYKHMLSLILAAIKAGSGNEIEMNCNCLLDLADVPTHFDTWSWADDYKPSMVNYVHVKLPTKKKPNPSVN